MARIAIDSCVFIYAIERNPQFGQSARRVLERLDDPDDPLVGVASSLVILEVLVHPLRLGRLDLAEVYRAFLTGSPEVLEILPMSSDIAVEAARLRALLPTLKTPDAIHCATAIISGADYLLTNDPALSSVPGLKTLMLEAWIAMDA